MQHHRVEYAEQIEVDHAKVRTLRLDIIRALFGFVFLQRSQVSLQRRTESARKFGVARLYRHMFINHRLYPSNYARFWVPLPSVKSLVGHSKLCRARNTRVQ